MSEELKNSLIVNAGIEQPDNINNSAIQRFKNLKRPRLSVDDYINGIVEGNITILSKAITILESTLAQHIELSQQIIEKSLPHACKSIRIGITGVPGAGKSTLIEKLGKHITNQGHKLAVLAIDPSSQRSGGSILGDKTRMELLSVDPNAFIRPSPSCGTLGGVARKTREIIVLCEAAGFDVIFVETVGVGQSEIAVHSMVDFFMLLQISGAGDELQGIKRGIMEMADCIVITKADGNNIQKAETTKGQYINALHLLPPKESNQTPQVITVSAVENNKIDALWKIVIEYINFVKENYFFDNNRNTQAKYWMNQTINETLSNHFKNTISKQQIKDIETKVINGKMTSFQGATILLDKYFNLLRND